MNPVRLSSRVVIGLTLIGVFFPEGLFAGQSGDPASLNASALRCQQPRYKLIDIGTFGGPASYFPNGLDGILNDRGTAVGWARESE